MMNGAACRCSFTKRQLSLHLLAFSYIVSRINLGHGSEIKVIIADYGIGLLIIRYPDAYKLITKSQQPEMIGTVL